MRARVEGSSSCDLCSRERSRYTTIEFTRTSIAVSDAEHASLHAHQAFPMDICWRPRAQHSAQLAGLHSLVA